MHLIRLSIEIIISQRLQYQAQVTLTSLGSGSGAYEGAAIMLQREKDRTFRETHAEGCHAK